MGKQVWPIAGGAVGVYDLDTAAADTNWVELTSASFTNQATGGAVPALGRFVQVQYVNESQNIAYVTFYEPDPADPATGTIRCLPDSITHIDLRGVAKTGNADNTRYLTKLSYKKGTTADDGQIVCHFATGDYAS